MGPTEPRNNDDHAALAGLDALLRERFGIPSFRDWQRDAVGALLRDRARVLLVAPTGGGKSLCYQFPAVALGGTALVLSPLISLMQDQVRGLEARGIEATFVASSLPREENGRRLAGMRRGAYRVVYAAPERLAFDGFVDALAASSLCLVAVDEAHCIVQWGHDFRPDYLRIGALLERLRPPRVIACTATATPEARADILRQLKWDPSTTTTILRGFARPNLHLSVREVDGPREGLRETTFALKEAVGPGKAAKGGAIVYAATRKRTEELADELRDEGFAARAYHAGLPTEERTAVNDAFAARKLPIVVATNAFGMGIDRPDVRAVVHAQPPASIEAYYQEVGRAGRDGEAATGLLLVAGADIALRRRMAELGPDGGTAKPEEVARQWGLFRELLRYVGAFTCRHDFILRYFGDEAESLGGCGQCDVCLAIEQQADTPEALAADVDAVRRALSGVARTKGRAGLQAVAAMLVGETNERVRKRGLDRLSTFGVLAGRSAEDAMGVLRVLLANDWIDSTTNEYPVPQITERGWQVMTGAQPVRVRLPPPRSALAERKRDRSRKPRRERGIAPSAGADDLVAALRRHRADLAKELGVPAYVVAPNTTLAEIAALRPKTLAELRQAKGMGPARLEAYGPGLLEIVARFADQA